MTEVSCDRERGAREGEKEAGKGEEEAGCKTEKHIRLKDAENKRRNQFGLLVLMAAWWFKFINRQESFLVCWTCSYSLCICT